MKNTIKNDTGQKFRKEQLLKSGIFDNIDIARAVLRDDKEYTVEEAKAAVESFKERKVK